MWGFVGCARRIEGIRTTALSSYCFIDLLNDDGSVKRTVSDVSFMGCPTRRRRHLEEDDPGNHQRLGEEISIDNRVSVTTIPRKRNLHMYATIRSLARTLTYDQIQNMTYV